MSTARDCSQAELKWRRSELDLTIRDKMIELAEAKRELASMGMISVPEPIERVDVQAIAKELSAIEVRNRERDVLEAERARVLAGLEGLQARISDARRTLAMLENDWAAIHKRADALPPSEPREGIAHLIEKLSSAASVEQCASEYDAARLKIADQLAVSRKIATIEGQIKSLQKEREEVKEASIGGRAEWDYASIVIVAAMMGSMGLTRVVIAEKDFMLARTKELVVEENPMDKTITVLMKEESHAKTTP